MSISIRKEIEKFDPSKNTNWKRDYINAIYESCKNEIGNILSNYKSNIIRWNNEFTGYDLSKDFDNHESSGQFHFILQILNESYLILSFHASGKYKNQGDRPTSNFDKVIFSIEKDIQKGYYPLDKASIDIVNLYRKYESEIKILRGEIL